MSSLLSELPKKPLSAARYSVQWVKLIAADKAGIRYFWKWLLSVTLPYDTIHDERPWFTLALVDWLDAYIQPHMNIFEWGSGGSTLFYARRAQRVISIEHEEAWYHRVSDAVRARGLTNIDLHITCQSSLTRESTYSEAHPFSVATSARLIDSMTAPLTSFLSTAMLVLPVLSMPSQNSATVASSC